MNDQRFRGYGLNKVCHAVAMASAGYSFKVAPWAETLVVAREHEKSAAYKATYGPACTDPLQALRVQALYNVALRELQPGQHSPPIFTPSSTTTDPSAGSPPKWKTKTSAGEEPYGKLTIVVADDTDADGG